MIHRSCQQDAVRLDAGGDDVVDHIVGLDTPEAAGVQAVVAGHAGMDLRPGLEHLELHPGGLHLPPDHLQHLGGVAVLSGTAVDGHDLHKLPLHNLVSPCCPSIIAEGWTAGKSSFSPIKRDALTGVSLGLWGRSPAVVVDVPAEDGPGDGVDLKFVLGPAVADLDFILRPAVIPVKLALHHRGAAGRLRQGDLLGPLCGDIVTAGRVAAVPGGAACAVVPDLEISPAPDRS